MYAVGGLAVEGTVLDVEGFVPAVRIQYDAVHALLFHGVRVGSPGVTFSESIIVDVIFAILGTPNIGICQEEALLF